MVSGQQSYNLGFMADPQRTLAFPRRLGTRVEACDADRPYSFRTLNLKASNVLCNQNSNKFSANPRMRATVRSPRRGSNTSLRPSFRW